MAKDPVDQISVNQRPAGPLRNYPQQDRARESLEKILDAAERLLEELGPERTTTRQIADRAGLSIGSLYRFFPDKSAIIRELVRRFISDMGNVPASLGAEIGELSVDEIEPIIRMMIERSLALNLKHPAWRSVRTWRYPDTGELVNASVRKAETAMVSAMLQALPVAIAPQTADFIAHVSLIASWPLLNLALDEPDRTDEIIDEAVFLITAYVTQRLHQLG